MTISGFVHYTDYWLGEAFFADVFIEAQKPKNAVYVGYMELNTGEIVLVFQVSNGYMGVIEKEEDS